MTITEDFVKEILAQEFPDNFQDIYDASLLLQYLDKKMKAVHGNSKTRRSLANIYAIYSILHFYEKDFYNSPDQYRAFQGYDYTKLFVYFRTLYGGSKLQNHALNSRVNGEFRNKFQQAVNDLILINDGKYLLHIEYLYILGHDISKVLCRMIEKYIALLTEKDHSLIQTLQELQQSTDNRHKIEIITSLLNEDVEARIFEIIS